MAAFCLINNGAVVFGPQPWSPAAFSAELQSLGLNVSLTDVAPAAEVDFGGGISMLPATVTPVAPTAFQTVGAAACAVANGVVTVTYPLADVALAAGQATQNGVLAGAYANAVVQPVAYTSQAAVAKTYQADPGSVANLQASLAGFAAAQATPAGFYWVAADNTQVPFTYADLQGLAAAMLAQGWTAFQHLQTQKAAVNAATTLAAVQAVTW